MSKRLQTYLTGLAMTLDQRSLPDLASELREIIPNQQPTKQSSGKKYRLIKNSIECRGCSDIIESKHVWDYVTCKCGAVAVDGGLDYCKRSGYPENYIELSTYEEIG